MFLKRPWAAREVAQSEILATRAAQDKKVATQKTNGDVVAGATSKGSSVKQYRSEC